MLSSNWVKASGMTISTAALITSGDLQAMVDHDGLLGMTSNPAIFEKALTGSADYDQPMQALVEQGVGVGHRRVMSGWRFRTSGWPADVLLEVYRKTEGKDGYVSLEVSPYLAHDTQATLEEARRLYKTVDRANVMIKVPATQAGVPAIAQLIGEGININVTLLFAVEAYEAVAEAYLDGLEQLAQRGGDLSTVASVASFSYQSHRHPDRRKTQPRRLETADQCRAKGQDRESAQGKLPLRTRQNPPTRRIKT